MWKHILAVLGLIVLAAIAIFAWIAWPDTAKVDFANVTGGRPAITTPRSQVFPTIGTADPVGWANGAKPTPAAGLKVVAFASGLDHPRWLYRLPNGDVLVAETNSPPRKDSGVKGFVMKNLMGKVGAGGASANRITLLRDADGDGVAEFKTVFMTGLNSPFGMALFQGQLYIGDTDALVRVPYKDGDTKITTRPEKVIDLPGGGNHWARNVIVAEDGQSLYVSVGSSSNVAENGIAAETRRANILQVWPDKNSRVYAAGLRNPNGMAIEPSNKRLWTVVNERDMLGSDLVPDYLTAVELGDHFGWPWYYWGGYLDERVEPRNPQLQQYAKRPDYAMGPHVAALGLAFAGADGVKLGGSYAAGAFVGEHGSWNRKPLSGYKVVFVPFTPQGWPVKGAKPVDVLTGFLSADQGKAYGRPVGVIADKAGALLVADDVGNTIWRVTPAA